MDLKKKSKLLTWCILSMCLPTLLSCGDKEPHLAPVYYESIFVLVCTKNNWEQHIPYLYHVAEIQRRQETCPVVTRVIINTTDSTSDDPVFRVGCGFANKPGEMKYFATDYTLDEVREKYSVTTVRADEPDIAPVASYAEFHTGQCKDPYAGNIPYLYYVAEIVRRHPDCYLVTDIDIKGKTRYKPTFEATCENNTGDEFTVTYGRKEVRDKYAAIYDLPPTFWNVESKFD